MADESGGVEKHETRYLLRFKPQNSPHIHLVVDHLVKYEKRDVVSLNVDSLETKYRVESVDDHLDLESLPVVPGTIPSHLVIQHIREVYLVPFAESDDEKWVDSAFPM